VDETNSEALARMIVGLGGKVMNAIGLAVVLAALLYFVPSLVALARAVPDRGMVVVLNVFLGWTFLGWVVALAKACGAK
jgi:T4 superinfection immunity protein